MILASKVIGRQKATSLVALQSHKNVVRDKATKIDVVSDVTKHRYKATKNVVRDKATKSNVVNDVTKPQKRR